MSLDINSAQGPQALALQSLQSFDPSVRLSVSFHEDPLSLPVILSEKWDGCCEYFGQAFGSHSSKETRTNGLIGLTEGLNTVASGVGPAVSETLYLLDTLELLEVVSGSVAASVALSGVALVLNVISFYWMGQFEDRLNKAIDAGDNSDRPLQPILELFGVRKDREGKIIEVASKKEMDRITRIFGIAYVDLVKTLVAIEHSGSRKIQLEAMKPLQERVEKKVHSSVWLQILMCLVGVVVGAACILFPPIGFLATAGVALVCVACIGARVAIYLKDLQNEKELIKNLSRKYEEATGKYDEAGEYIESTGKKMQFAEFKPKESILTFSEEIEAPYYLFGRFS